MDLPLFGRKKKTSGIVRDYEKALEDAKAAMKRGDEDKALILFRRLNRWVTEDFDKINSLPPEEKAKISRILTEAGENMLTLKEYDYAIKTLEKAKILDPTNIKAWLAIGRDLLERNVQIPYAIACLKEAVKLEPNNVEAQTLLGDAFRMQGQLDEALEAYHMALKADPDNENVILKVLKIQPNNIEILERYAEVLKKKKRDVELLRIYNQLYSLTKDEKYLEMGLDIDPGNKDLLLTKVRILMDRNDFVEAGRIVEQLKEDYPDDPTVQMLYEELTAEEKEEEEIKPIAVEELFGDLGIEETEEIAETKEAPPETSEAVETVESEEAPKIEKYEEFLNAFNEGKLDTAKQILSELSEADFEKVMKSEVSYELAEFIIENMDIEHGMRIIDSFLTQNRVAEVENFLNEILKKNMKDAKAMLFKSIVMAHKDNEMGAKNFLMMSLKFDPSLKEFAKKNATLQKYAEKDWYKNMLS
jgi:tetratricopeptide (TPR) repeat protein